MQKDPLKQSLEIKNFTPNSEQKSKDLENKNSIRFTVSQFEDENIEEDQSKIINNKSTDKPNFLTPKNQVFGDFAHSSTEPNININQFLLSSYSQKQSDQKILDKDRKIDFQSLHSRFSANNQGASPKNLRPFSQSPLNAKLRQDISPKSAGTRLKQFFVYQLKSSGKNLLAQKTLEGLSPQMKEIQERFNQRGMKHQRTLLDKVIGSAFKEEDLSSIYQSKILISKFTQIEYQFLQEINKDEAKSRVKAMQPKYQTKVEDSRKQNTKNRSVKNSNRYGQRQKQFKSENLSNKTFRNDSQRRESSSSSQTMSDQLSKKGSQKSLILSPNNPSILQIQKQNTKKRATLQSPKPSYFGKNIEHQQKISKEASEYQDLKFQNGIQLNTFENAKPLRDSNPNGSWTNKHKYSIKLLNRDIERQEIQENQDQRKGNIKPFNIIDYENSPRNTSGKNENFLQVQPRVEEFKEPLTPQALTSKNKSKLIPHSEFQGQSLQSRKRKNPHLPPHPEPRTSLPRLSGRKGLNKSLIATNIPLPTSGRSSDPNKSQATLKEKRMQIPRQSIDKFSKKYQDFGDYLRKHNLGYQKLIKNQEELKQKQVTPQFPRENQNSDSKLKQPSFLSLTNQNGKGNNYERNKISKWDWVGIDARIRTESEMDIHMKSQVSSLMNSVTLNLGESISIQNKQNIRQDAIRSELEETKKQISDDEQPKNKPTNQNTNLLNSILMNLEDSNFVGITNLQKPFSNKIQNALKSQSIFTSTKQSIQIDNRSYEHRKSQQQRRNMPNNKRFKSYNQFRKSSLNQEDKQSRGALSSDESDRKDFKDTIEKQIDLKNRSKRSKLDNSSITDEREIKIQQRVSEIQQAIKSENFSSSSSNESKLEHLLSEEDMNLSVINGDFALKNALIFNNSMSSIAQNVIETFTIFDLLTKIHQSQKSSIHEIKHQQNKINERQEAIDLELDKLVELIISFQTLSQSKRKISKVKIKFRDVTGSFEEVESNRRYDSQNYQQNKETKGIDMETSSFDYYIENIEI